MSLEETHVFQAELRRKGGGKHPSLTTMIPKYLADMLGLKHGDLISLRFQKPDKIIIEKYDVEKLEEMRRLRNMLRRQIDSLQIGG